MLHGRRFQYSFTALTETSRNDCIVCSPRNLLVSIGTPGPPSKIISDEPCSIQLFLYNYPLRQIIAGQAPVLRIEHNRTALPSHFECELCHLVRIESGYSGGVYS